MSHWNRDALDFAQRMRRIPRKPLRCEFTGAVRAVVDERHARNIFKKVAPLASAAAIYDALAVLQDRLDDEVNPAQGWRES